VNEKEIIEHKTLDGRVMAYIPVMDESGSVVAVISIKVQEGQVGSVSDDNIKQVKNVTTVLSNCISSVKKEKLGEFGSIQSLEAEGLDEHSKRQMLFPKMMLKSTRDSLAKLEKKALSELHSYKKPPVTIHRVVKGVLYLFGKLPKEGKIYHSLFIHDIYADSFFKRV
jgi:hypothetical protein